MAKMGKSHLLLAASFLLLSYTASADGGLDEACKKTPEPEFCTTLLQPSAAEFSSGDPKKMDHAAINAALGKIIAGRTFLMGRAMMGAKDKELKAAIEECSDSFRHGEGSLSVALRELDTTGEANAPKKEAKAVTTRMVGIAFTELNTCHEAMKKSEAAGMAAGGADADITKELMRSTEESAKACAVAKAFIEE